MRKNFSFITAVILAVFTLFSPVKSWAYSLNWGIPFYYSYIYTEAYSYDYEGGDYYDYNVYTSNESLLNSYLAVGPYTSAYAGAYPKFNDLESTSSAYSEASDSWWGYADAYSYAYFYNTFTITGGPDGEIVPSYLTANLSGELNKDMDDDSYAYSGVGASIWGVDSWNFNQELSDSGLIPINASYSNMIYPQIGSEYAIYADLWTWADAYGTAYASSVFSPTSFSFNVRPVTTENVVPEPASLSLLGLGLLGLLTRRKPRRDNIVVKFKREGR